MVEPMRIQVNTITCRIFMSMSSGNSWVHSWPALDADEQQEVQELLIWWNQYAQLLVYYYFVFRLTVLHRCRQTFPGYSSTQHVPAKDSVHAIMMEKQAPAL